MGSLYWIWFLATFLPPRRPAPADEVERRLRHLAGAWDRAWVSGVTPMYPARPYPQLGDEAAWQRREELLRYIEAEMEA